MHCSATLLTTENTFKRTKSFACKTLARPRYCATINSISAVCASSRSVFYVIGNCIAISYYKINTLNLAYIKIKGALLSHGSTLLFYSFTLITKRPDFVLCQSTPQNNSRLVFKCSSVTNSQQTSASL